MKSYIKYLTAVFFQYSGLNSMIMNRGIKTYFLMFHRLGDELDLLHTAIPHKYFEQVIAVLNNKGKVKDISDYVTNGSSKLSFIITFDDGYEDNMLVKSQASETPMIIYLATGFVESEKKFWATYMQSLIFDSSTDFLDLQKFSLGRYELVTLDEKKMAITELNVEIKKFSSIKIDEIISSIQYQCSKKLVKGNDFLDWKQVKMLHNAGVTFGSHTHNHSITTRITREKFREELNISTDILKHQLGKNVKHFAYPNGRKIDIASFTKEELINKGYQSAVTTIEGVNYNNSNKLELKRINVAKNRVESPFGKFSKSMFFTMLTNPFGIH